MAILGILGLFVFWIVRHGVRFVQVNFRYDEPLDEALRDWVGYYTGWLAGDGYIMVAQGLGTVTYSRQYTPRWAVAVAVFFFPIGLLALLARTNATLVVRAEDDEPGTYIGVSGDAHRRIANELERDAASEAGP